MRETLSRFDDRIYALVRIVVGFLFLCHGVQKLFFSDGPPETMPAPLFYAAGGIELVAGGLIALGLLGSAMHLHSNLVGDAPIVAERFIRGAPFMAPLLFCNMGLLGLLAMLPADERS